MTDEELLQKAKEAALNAYVPYTEFPVGSAVLTESGHLFVGCNVENASYGSSLCAERAAIAAAVTAGEYDIAKIALYAPKLKRALSCGTCRQWIWQFSNGKNIPIIVEGQDGKPETYYLNDLLPFPYDRKR